MWQFLAWNCLKSNGTGCAKHPAVPGRKEHPRTGTTSLFTWSCSVWLFCLQAGRDYQREPFWKTGGYESRNDGDEGHPRRILPALCISIGKKNALNLSEITLKLNHVVYWITPVLEIEPATTNCRSETLQLSQQSIAHTRAAKLTCHGKCVTN